MRKMLDKVFTGSVVFLLVSSAFFSYYLRPWRWMRFNRARLAVPDDPFAGIPLPAATETSTTNKVEKAVV